ncbi:MAG TPA: RluA family pseudouridine synthase [Lachnospiraceae bacterium]
MNRELIYHIKKDESILDFLKSEGYPRSILRGFKHSKDNVLLNGDAIFLNHHAKPGDILTVIIKEDASSENIIPSPLPISVLFEDEDIILLNKAADMPVHPSLGNYDNTLANALAFYYEKKNELFTFRCITRLDRDTTGVLLIAKNALSAAILSKDMVNRKIKRTYLAIAEGLLPQKEGCIDAPIARQETSVISRQVDFSLGERAITNYKVLHEKNIADKYYSLVQLNLETGRTHQIRVHLKYIGNPLPGDFLYNPTYDVIKRQALHSSSIEFFHPIKKEKLLIKAPLPYDMQFIL